MTHRPPYLSLSFLPIPPERGSLGSRGAPERSARPECRLPSAAGSAGLFSEAWRVRGGARARILHQWHARMGVWPYIHIHGVFFGVRAFLRSPLLAQLQRDAPHAPDRGESRRSFLRTPLSLSPRWSLLLYWVPRPAATTLNFSEFSSPYSSMAGAADGLDPDGSNKSAFMEIQQQGLAGMAHHGQPYPIRSTYSAVSAPQHEAAFASAQHPRPLGANPFPMNYNPLHNTYSHPSHPYLSTYPANVPTCPSPTRDGKSI